MATTSTIGVQDIINLAAALADTATVIDGVVANGAPKWTDLPKLFTVVSALKEFGTVNYKNLLPEISDLQDTEVTAIVGAFNGHLGIKEATAVAVLETGFELIVRAAEAVQTIKAVVDQIIGQVKPAA